MAKGSDELDLSNLTVEPAELLPVPRGKAPEPNPLIVHLEKSWVTPKSFRVPARQAPGLEAKLRKTAMRMGYGVAVQFQVGPENNYISGAKVKQLDPQERVRVVFQIHEKYKAARHEQDNETDN
jgi:hypothetical protein